MTRLCSSCISFLLTFLAAASAVALPTRTYTVRDGLLNNQGRMVVELPGGQMMVKTEGGFFLHDGVRFVPVGCNEERCLEQPWAHAGKSEDDEHGLLWLRDQLRIYVFDTRSRQFRYDIAELLVQYGMPDWDEQVDVACDRQGGIWECTFDQGTRYTRPDTPVAHTYGADDGIPAGVRGMALAADSMVIVGTNDGIYGLTIDGDHVPHAHKLCECGVCINVQSDSRGRVWVSTLDGLFCYEDGRARRVYPQGGSDSATPSFRFCTELAGDHFLICSGLNHLAVMDAQNMVTPLASQPLLARHRTLAFAERAPEKGMLWLGTQNGILRYSVHEQEVIPFLTDSVEDGSLFDGHSNKVNVMMSTSSSRRKGNTLWLGTQNGLLSGSRWLTTADGLPNNCIQSLTADGEGNLWVATSYGVACILLGSDDEVRDIIPFGEDDGFAQTSYAERASLRLGDLILLGCAEGLTITAPSAMRFGNMRLRLALTNVATNRRASLPYSLYEDGQPISLPYDENFITLSLSAFNYAAPSHTRYRYRLEGIDGAWTECRGGHCVARYTALQPGTYTFVCQTAVDGQEWGDDLRCQVVVRPPFWRTWWAWTLYLLLCVAIAYLSFRFFLRIKRDQMLAEFVKTRKALEQKLDKAKAVPEITNRDEELVRRVQKCVEEHMEDTAFNVEALSETVGMDRSNLYKKLQSITGKTPSEFIREIRLHRAADLLRQGDHSVEEVVWMTGFGTARYFRTHFRNHYGCLPSEYKAKSENSLPSEHKAKCDEPLPPEP